MKETVAVDVHRVVTKLRTLALDRDNQPVIVRRGVTTSLVSFLSQPHYSTNVKIIACETIKMLSSHPDNTDLMSKEPNIIESLVALYKSEVDKTNTLCTLIHEIINNLYMNLGREQLELLPNDLISVQAPMNEQINASNIDAKKKKRRKKRNVVLQIEQLTNEKQRQRLEELILQLKGTISYTFNVPKKQVTVYTRTSTDKILEELAKNSYTISVISDSVCETEYNNINYDKENYQPQYLSPEKTQAAQKQPTKASSYMQSLVACEDNSLQARRKKKQQQQPKEENGSGVTGFISKITSVFW
ncbi:predicted protein [Naegleria gruberi]|uniref:Armadillo repeat-containing protein 1 n=1 Tax=Naegleria gruberi TaxID=5762 RepID=D2VCW4_NAEGR|nr:uncharacterized protein NAEGRDRAFT_66714 [Naegleria gruberi]EFC45492.1 predicted protein [Naegleria gruberi]|eukprot:XP_002678236.1 predicted protein [Naegleria gruberi strain NEG-M]